MPDNKSLMLVIALLLAGILGVLVYRETHQTPGDKIQAGLNDAAEGLGDAVKNMGSNIKHDANR